MATIQLILREFSNVIWGVPMIFLLVGTGLFLTIRLRGIQLRGLLKGLYLALIVRREKGGEGDISHFQALMTALAATVGVGNIAGVAAAIAAGGPGALFWMWLTGLLGMATKYSEALLGVRFRRTGPSGVMAGGPMYYLEYGIGGPFGKTLGVAFAVCAAGAAFGIGNMVQSNSVADALRTSFDIPPLGTGIVLALLVGLVTLGGIKSIGRVTGFFVPMMVAFYMIGGLTVLAINWRALDDALWLVLHHAFTPHAALGGFAGTTVRNAIRWGFSRGIFSNESGLGTGGIAAAAAQTQKPARQALVSMTQTFIDTIVVCTITGLVIISTQAWTEVDPNTAKGLTGAPLTMAAFRHGLPGQWGGIVVSLGLAFFAFSTILGWAYYGERAVEYLIGAGAIRPYRLLFVVAALLGAAVLQLEHAAGFKLVWDFSDIMNGAMAIPNLIGLVWLSKVVVDETRATQI